MDVHARRLAGAVLRKRSVMPGLLDDGHVTASDLDDAFGRWQSALADALNSPANVMAWQDRRYVFAHRLGQLLVGTAPEGPLVTDHAVYGIYVRGGGLLYVGQTKDAKRRLRDLPVGESHHVANTVPPETWERVIVVQWPSLLGRIPAEEAQAVEQLGPSTCGLAIEYQLQAAYQPVLNSRRRSTAGGWTVRNMESSRSRGAAASSQLRGLFREVRAQWDTLAGVQKGDGHAILCSDGGRVVFPGSL
jgi:hypothetical protein